MKYKKEIEQLLKEFFFEDWMDDIDWQFFLEEFYLIISLETLSKDIETGIKNGYTLNFQIEMIKTTIFAEKVKMIKTEV